MIRFFVFIILFLFSQRFLAQEDVVSDTTDIISFVDKIIVKANIESQSESFFFTDNSEQDLVLSTSDRLRFTLSLDYEFIGFSIGYSPKIAANDNQLKGKSSFSDYRFRFFLGNWTQNIQYRRAAGFYVANTDELIPEWVVDRDPYVQFPNLKTIFWGGSTSYVINPKFSLRNITYNTEWQRKSAGSFIPTLRYGYNRLSGRIEDEKIYKNNFDIGLALGYYYTWVIHKNWFVSPYLTPSIGFRYTNYDNEGKVEREGDFLTFLDGGLQLGYSSKKVIFGMNYNFEDSWAKEGKGETTYNDRSYAKIYIGYRFNAPKAVQKKFDEINKKLGL